MKKLLMTVLSVAAIAAFAKTPEVREKRVLFLGDSITDKCHVGCTSGSPSAAG